MTYQTTFGLQADEEPILGEPQGVEGLLVESGAGVGAIDFGDALEWVSEVARTVKKFDGTGTICGFALKDKSRNSTAGYVAGDQIPIMFAGKAWVKAAAALTVGAIYPGVAQSVVKTARTIGGVQAGLIQMNQPARGPAI